MPRKKRPRKRDVFIVAEPNGQPDRNFTLRSAGYSDSDITDLDRSARRVREARAKVARPGRAFRWTAMDEMELYKAVRLRMLAGAKVLTACRDLAKSEPWSSRAASANWTDPTRVLQARFVRMAAPARQVIQNVKTGELKSGFKQKSPRRGRKYDF